MDSVKFHMILMQTQALFPCLPDNGGTDAWQDYDPTHLGLQFVSLGILPLHFSINILLKLFHVEKFKRFVHLQKAVGKFKYVVAHRCLLGRILNINVGLGNSLDQNISTVVHL